MTFIWFQTRLKPTEQASRLSPPVVQITVGKRGSRRLFLVVGYVAQMLGNDYKNNLVHIKNSDIHFSGV